MGIFRIIKRKFKTFDDIIRPLAYGKWDYFLVATDYFYCRYILKITQDEYTKYHFAILKPRYRKHFILQQHRSKYLNINTRSLTWSKYVFYQYIPDLFNREIILAPQCGMGKFVDFLKRHGKIAVKPDTGSLGQGVQIVQYSSDQAAEAFFNSIPKECPVVCEEFIRQHPVLAQLNPSSVNTIRIASLLIDGEVDIFSATLKCGAGADRVTDNLSLGGIGAQIDIPSGIVTTFGKDYAFNTYTHHPVTGTQIIGIQIPHWDATLELIKKAHKRLPQCAFFAWDVAITETGAEIVEANSKSGTRIMQAFDSIPKGQKLLPLMKKDRLKEKQKEYYDDWKKRLYQFHNPQ